MGSILSPYTRPPSPRLPPPRAAFPSAPYLLDELEAMAGDCRRLASPRLAAALRRCVGSLYHLYTASLAMALGRHLKAAGVAAASEGAVDPDVDGLRERCAGVVAAGMVVMICCMTAPARGSARLLPCVLPHPVRPPPAAAAAPPAAAARLAASAEGAMELCTLLAERWLPEALLPMSGGAAAPAACVPVACMRACACVCVCSCAHVLVAD